jgi:maleamate amidohydrolase
MDSRGRVWEQFLTEQDRAHLTRTPDRRVGFGNRPALVLIDLYRWVFGDAPQPLLEAVESWPGSCGLAAWQALPAIQRLLGLARELALPVVHLTGLDVAGRPGWSEASHGGVGRGGVGTAGAASTEKRRRRYDIIDEVAPIPGEVVLRKTTPSGFNGTPLLHHLNSLSVDTIIVAGESTSGCVRASVVDGCSYRFRVIVVEECVFDRHQAAHAINLFDMHTKYADVLSLAEVEAHLRSGSGPRPNGSSTQLLSPPLRAG